MQLSHIGDSHAVIESGHGSTFLLQLVQCLLEVLDELVGLFGFPAILGIQWTLLLALDFFYELYE